MREYLKKLREEHDMSQHDVAKAIGITRQYYEMIENGKRQKQMDITLVTSLARVFSVSAEEIINNERKLFSAN
jgi:DNA-binding XRE family transcriptional regulator